MEVQCTYLGSSARWRAGVELALRRAVAQRGVLDVARGAAAQLVQRAVEVELVRFPPLLLQNAQRGSLDVVREATAQLVQRDVVGPVLRDAGETQLRVAAQTSKAHAAQGPVLRDAG